MERQFLLIDADDTLWENNIYFERAVEEFIAFLGHSTLPPAEVRAVLDEIERASKAYGAANFARNLEATFRHLVEREVTEADLARVHGFAARIRAHPVELLPGVATTLAYLAARHTLMLLTKGDCDEQQMKIDASGLAPYFEETLILPEKDVPAYRQLADELTLEPARTWMIGNSPRSDINPALAVGFNAVYVPHPHTWVLEQQEICPDGSGTLVTIAAFVELREHF
jgi:putative hydrolase of the HAD superfamily